MAENLYRKWRPRSFAALAGQEHVSTTLTNALAGGRVAHAYLLAGPRGTGKTSTGRLLGKALNCRDRQAGEPCNRCESCLSFLSGRAMDLIELDAASNRGIDEIRSLREKVAFAPGAGDFKVYLIDEVHMLTEPAFNALLKTLEEPPPHAVFILATTEAHKVPATIASRCQRFDFRRVPLAAAVTCLEQICAGEAIECEPAALELIARSATGSMRDAINLLDQLATSYGNTLTVEHAKAGLGLLGDERAGRLARLVLAGDLAGGLELIASVRDDGLDLRQFQRELVDELRALLLTRSGLEPDGVTAERDQALRSAVDGVPTADLLRALRAFGEADLKADPSSTLPLDIALAECVLGREPVESTTAAPRPAAAPARAAAPAPRPAPPKPEPAIAEAPPRDEPPPPVEPTNESPPPAAQPAASQPTGAAAVIATLAAARELMRPIYDRTRELEVHVGALINSVCDIIDVDESSVTFGFKYPVHSQKILEPANLSVLKSAVTEIMGRPVDVSCVHDATVESWKQRETARRSPLVRAAQELGGRVLQPEPEEQP